MIIQTNNHLCLPDKNKSSLIARNIIKRPQQYGGKKTAGTLLQDKISWLGGTLRAIELILVMLYPKLTRRKGQKPGRHMLRMGWPDYAIIAAWDRW